MLEHWETLQEGWVNALETLYDLFLILDNLLRKGGNLNTVADLDLEIGGRSSRPLDKGGGRSPKNIFRPFGPQFRLEIRPGAPLAPHLDPPQK